MATRKFLGRHKLVSRLAAQVGSEGMAIALLKKRGDMTSAGKLTPAGKKRDSMTAAERAKDRAVKSAPDKAGHTTKDYVYNPKTNAATLKKSSPRKS